MYFKHIALVVALTLSVAVTAQNTKSGDYKSTELGEMKKNSKKADHFHPDTVSHEFLLKVSPSNPYHVCNPSIVTFSNEPTTLPDYGKRNMFIFYVDPDSYFDNRALERELKQDGKKGWEGKTYSPKIKGYGILNLADTRLSSGFIRGLAKMVLSNAPSVNLADNDHSLRDAWRLPNVNNKFVMMFVTKQGDMVYYREGPLSRTELDELYRMMQAYR